MQTVNVEFGKSKAPAKFYHKRKRISVDTAFGMYEEGAFFRYLTPSCIRKAKGKAKADAKAKAKKSQSKTRQNPVTSNLFYDLPNELQRKIEIMRPTEPIAQLVKDELLPKLFLMNLDKLKKVVRSYTDQYIAPLVDMTEDSLYIPPQDASVFHSQVDIPNRSRLEAKIMSLVAHLNSFYDEHKNQIKEHVWDKIEYWGIFEHVRGMWFQLQVGDNDRIRGWITDYILDDTQTIDGERYDIYKNFDLDTPLKWMLLGGDLRNLRAPTFRGRNFMIDVKYPPY